MVHAGISGKLLEFFKFSLEFWHFAENNKLCTMHKTNRQIGLALSLIPRLFLPRTFLSDTVISLLSPTGGGGRLIVFKHFRGVLGELISSLIKISLA